MAECGAEGDHIADEPLIQKPFRGGVCFCKPLILRNQQPFACFLRLGKHCLTVFLRGGHGLFTEDVFARLQCRNGERGMGIVGRADGNRIYRGVCKHLFRGEIDLPAVFFRHVFRSAGGGVIETDKLHMAVGSIFRNVAYLGNFSAAQNSNI